MAVRKTSKDQSQAGKPKGDVVEQKVVALAEQLGRFLGPVRNKSDDWLDRQALLKEVGRIRDGAADLFAQVKRTGAGARKAVAKPAAAAARPSRGAVDAPGKRHRKPPPNETLDKRMGEPVGKKVGQKSVRNSMRRGRG